MRRIATACLALLATGPLRAAVNDVLPGDFTPLPRGASSAALYLIDRDLSGPYVQGRSVGRARVDGRFAALRLTHAFDLAGLTASLVGVLAATRLEVRDLGRTPPFAQEATGMMDPRVGLTVWLMNDPERRRYLGVNGLLFPPIGGYDETRVVNSGENRWKGTLSVGWIEGLGEAWTLDLTAEGAFYADNEDYLGTLRLGQDATFALTGYLRYRLAPGRQLFVGAQWNGGGATSLNQAAFRNGPHERRATLGVSQMIDPTTQVMLRYGRDIEVDTGNRMDHDLSLRVLRLF